MRLKKRASTAIVGGFLSLICSLQSWAAPSSSPEGLADGAGVWLNMWNYPDNAESYCLKLNANGVRNIFIQTSRSNTDVICNPDKLGQLVDAAHRYKIHVVAWSFAELQNINRDADRLIAAAQFRSPQGERLDAIAANMEKDLAQPKVEAYSQRIRDAVGSSYPMVAVVYSPLNHAPQVATIPWKTLDRYYNVIAPMNYWNSKYERLEPYAYTLATIRKVRELVGKPDVEVHVIGDGMGTHAESINQFLAACKSGAATSASLYPNQQMTEEQLGCLSHYSDYFASNSRFRLAAFRELSHRGDIVLPEQSDPSDAITRGDFYRLLVRQVVSSAVKPTAQKVSIKTKSQLGSASALVDTTSMRQKLDAPEFGPADALNILLEIGAIKLPDQVLGDAVSDYLDAPLSTREAVDTAARVVDARDKLKKAVSEANLPPQNRFLRNISSKAGKLLVQPAYAENAQDRTDHSRKLNYLDASQIVLQSMAGLK